MRYGACVETLAAKPTDIIQRETERTEERGIQSEQDAGVLRDTSLHNAKIMNPRT